MRYERMAGERSISRTLFSLMLVAALITLRPSGAAAQDVPGHQLLVDTSSVGTFRCGEFYVLPVYQVYRLNSESPPMYRQYGELLLYRPCREPLSGGDFPVEVVEAINCFRRCENACGCAVGALRQPFVLRTIVGASVPRPRFFNGAVVLPAVIESVRSDFKSYQVLVRTLGEGGMEPADAAIRAKYPEYTEIYAPAYRVPRSSRTRYLFLLGRRGSGQGAGTLDLIVDPIAEVADCSELRDVIESRLPGPGRR